MKQSDFKFRPDEKALFLEVYYEGEENYRYLINVIQQTCTCIGFSVREKCKHVDKLKVILKMIGGQTLKPFHLS